MVEALKFILASLGAITGTVALGWRLIDEFGAYLRISVKVELAKNGWITALTTVDNKGNRLKKIDYSILLIGPEAESPIETATILASNVRYKGRLKDTNDLECFQVDKAILGEGRALIPLEFYYSENIALADETLTYRVPVNTESFKSSVPYAVRFFVFSAPRLHRSTQDVFIL
jgi:hypothetical protein